MSALCVYGVKEALYTSLEEWLKDNFLIFIEEASFSEFEHPLFHDPQVKIYLLNPYNEEETFKQIGWDFAFVPFSYEPSGERGEYIFARIAFFQSGVELLTGDYRDFGETILENVRKNMKLLPSASRGLALSNAFVEIPAIICGAGPSLVKNMAQLGGLLDRALIFAGGSALKVLSDCQIRPHFGAGVDPTSYRERFLEQSAFEIPFFYQDRISKDLLSLVEGPLLWMPDTGAYSLERWVGEKLLSEKPFDSGWTVGNFCTAISLRLGCNPIIFVGMDLSPSDTRLYAPGVEGSSLSDRKDWIMSGHWTEELVLQYPDRQFINATEGGRGFKGIEESSLESVTQKYLKKSFDLLSKIHVELQRIEKIKLTESAVADVWGLVEESLARCREKVSQLLTLMEEAYPHSPLEQARFILFEYECEEELIYTHYLQPLWNIWQPLFKRRRPELFKEPVSIKLNQLLFYQRSMENLWKDMK